VCSAKLEQAKQENAPAVEENLTENQLYSWGRGSGELAYLSKSESEKVSDYILLMPLDSVMFC
jgi:hypothetical protein